MGSAVGEILPLGVGVAVSPLPIIAVILMLFTRRAKSNAPAFLAGWVVGLVVVGVIVLLISNRVDVATYDERSTAASALRALVGVLLLFLAWRQWQSRPEEGEETQMPRWMQRMESVNPATALGLGALLSCLNPKDTTLTILAAVAIARAGLSAGESAVTLAVFIAIATISVVAPVTLYFALGERAEETLNDWRAWLSENNATVMAVLLLVFGVVLVVQGIRGLTN
jgi:threonine/homoserine/homoserine lactone efflux protein